MRSQILVADVAEVVPAKRTWYDLPRALPELPPRVRASRESQASHSHGSQTADVVPTERSFRELPRELPELPPHVRESRGKQQRHSRESQTAEVAPAERFVDELPRELPESHESQPWKSRGNHNNTSYLV